MSAVDSAPTYCPRGKASLPPMRDVAGYWSLPIGVCFRCGANARCERAHVIDRRFDGLDDVQNLVPLCFRCHREMPPFIAGEEWKAALWLTTLSEHDYCLAIATTSGALALTCAGIDLDTAVADADLRMLGTPVMGFASPHAEQPRPHVSEGGAGGHGEGSSAPPSVPLGTTQAKRHGQSLTGDMLPVASRETEYAMEDAQILARVIDSTPVEIAEQVSALAMAAIVHKTLEVVRS